MTSVPRAPMRLAHLGLGAFHRAHQAWYTEHANRAGCEEWRIAAFTGRSPDAALALAATDHRYELILRGVEGDRTEVISAIVEAYDGSDVVHWRHALTTAAVLTVTVTEAGYVEDAAQDASDVHALRSGDFPVTPAARIIDGLRERFSRGEGPMAIVSCDNLDGNGVLLKKRVIAIAGEVDLELSNWIEREISFVSSVVDRITPAEHEGEGLVAEPYSSWVLQGDFPAGRPRWETAGATFVDDIEPYEKRKLWLLNAGHTLLALVGLLRGHASVADAMRDPECVAMLEELWDGVGPALIFSAEQLAEERASIRARFENDRINHSLAQIAKESDLKIAVRILPVIKERRRHGLDAGIGHLRAVIAWSTAVRLGELPGPVLRTSPADAAVDALRFLSPDLADDAGVVEQLVGVATALDLTGAKRAHRPYKRLVERTRP